MSKRLVSTNMKAFLRLAVTLAAGTGLTVCSALAGPIVVNNYSFEQLSAASLDNAGCGPGCSYSTALPIPDWSISGAGGQFQPGPSPSPYFNTIPDGITVAYSNSTGSIISQTVVPVVQQGVTYTLLVDLGKRPDAGFGASASLLVNGLSYAATGLAPADGDWSTYTATYIGTLADAGSSITIQLEASGPQADFDNVRLSDSTNTPEPGVMPLLGSGLVALAFFARRKSAAAGTTR